MASVKHSPEIIAARINFEAAKLNATIAEMSSENSGRLSDGYALAWSGEMFVEARAEHEAAVAAILAELESPSPDTVIIGRESARVSLAELRAVAEELRDADQPAGNELYSAIEELERVLEAK